MERRGADPERPRGTIEADGRPVEQEPFMQHDGSNSARARSARIRTSHDYEATELDTMRRHAAARELRQRPSFVMRLSSLVGRARGLGAETVQALDAESEREIGARVDV
jgi:hypothetical protein